jgi:hypothetical protein
MKQGRKKIGKDEDGSRKPVPEEAGSEIAGGDDSGTSGPSRDMNGGNPDGIDAIQALQMIAGGIFLLVLVLWGLRNILHVI